MLRMLRLLGTMVAIGLLGAAVTGCASGQRGTQPTADAPETQSSDATAAVAQPVEERAPADDAPPTELVADGAQETVATEQEADQQTQQDAEEKAKKEAKDAEEKAKKEAKEARQRQRKLPKLERELEVARMRLAKARVVQGSARIKFEESVEKAQSELALAQRKLQELKATTGPNRVARSQLNLQRAEDGFKDAQQELEQLELMYSDEQLADKTKEIVIERARRRLHRSQRDLELRREEHQALINARLPRETIEQVLQVKSKKVALAQLRRGEEAAVLEREIAVLNAQAAIVKLENDLVDVREEIEEAAQKQAEQEREKAANKEAVKTDKP